MSRGMSYLVSKQQRVEMQNVFHTLAVPALYSFIATPLAVASVPLNNAA
jgi:hypothetical protein